MGKKKNAAVRLRDNVVVWGGLALLLLACLSGLGFAALQVASMLKWLGWW